MNNRGGGGGRSVQHCGANSSNNNRNNWDWSELANVGGAGTSNNYARNQYMIAGGGSGGGGRPAGLSDEDSDSDYYDDDYNGSGYKSSSSQHNKQPKTPLSPIEEYRIACLNSELDVALGLLNDAKVRIDDTTPATGWSPLMIASSYGAVPLVQRLIELGCNVNFSSSGPSGSSANNNGLTALMTLSLGTTSVDEGALLDCAKLLLGAGANVNAKDGNGMTPLMFAARDGNLEMVKYLLESGAEINAQERDGRTALELAAASGHGRIIRVMLQRDDIDVVSLNEIGQTASEVANENGHQKISDVLYNAETTKWRPGQDPSLLDEPIDTQTNKKILERNMSSHDTKMENSEITQIEMILENLGLKEPYYQNFIQHKISYLNFLNLNEHNLIDIGIESSESRSKLLESIDNIHNRGWIDSGVTPIYLRSNITSSEIICILNNTSKHLACICSKLQGLKSKASNNSEMLEIGSEQTPISQIMEYAEKSLEAMNGLQNQIKEFECSLQKITGGENCTSEAPIPVLDEVTSFQTILTRTSLSLLKWGALGSLAAFGAGALLVKAKSSLLSLS